MNKGVLLISLLIVSLCIADCTVITWNKSNLVCTEDFVVYETDELIISAGANITFTNGSKVIVYGDLKVQGTSNDKVVFIGSNGYNPLIVFQGSRLERSIIQHALFYGSSKSISVEYSTGEDPLIVSQCEFESAGISVTHSSIRIENSMFHTIDADSSIDLQTSDGSIIVDNSTFEGDLVGSTYPLSLSCSGPTAFVSVRNSRITGHNPILFNGCQNVDLTNNIITASTLRINSKYGKENATSEVNIIANRFISSEIIASSSGNLTVAESLFTGASSIQIEESGPSSGYIVVEGCTFSRISQVFSITGEGALDLSSLKFINNTIQGATCEHQRPLVNLNASHAQAGNTQIYIEENSFEDSVCPNTTIVFLGYRNSSSYATVELTVKKNQFISEAPRRFVDENASASVVVDASGSSAVTIVQNIFNNAAADFELVVAESNSVRVDATYNYWGGNAPEDRVLINNDQTSEIEFYPHYASNDIENNDPSNVVTHPVAPSIFNSALESSPSTPVPSEVIEMSSSFSLEPSVAFSSQEIDFSAVPSAMSTEEEAYSSIVSEPTISYEPSDAPEPTISLEPSVGAVSVAVSVTVESSPELSTEPEVPTAISSSNSNHTLVVVGSENPRAKKERVAGWVVALIIVLVIVSFTAAVVIVAAVLVFKNRTTQKYRSLRETINELDEPLNDTPYRLEEI